MSTVAILLAGSFALYCGFYYLLARILDIGIPIDALRGGIHRTWLGGAATFVVLVVHMFMRLGGASPEATELGNTVSTWGMRLAVWVFVTTHVYRVTRWRKGKLAIVVVLGLALNVAVDYGLARLGSDRGFMPSFGSWPFRLC